ncbi:hypothetical protein Naga_100036g21 [Nannochloropsis gaditana]|uniref:Uncharacterized protein n=1 Tax=Nannochloropsis gaditana TaxID=72520 RepID=W7TX77_9STRA|nr:hypothetical protein Naga_100036g21 [Nannochloropsis gaditana]
MNNYLLPLVLAFLCHYSFAFIKPFAPKIRSQRLTSLQPDGNAHFRRSRVVVSMGKGRKAEKKRKSAPPARREVASPKAAPGSQTQDKEPESFGILGSDGGMGPINSQVGVGFGTPKASSPGKLSPVDVDDAYERALSKVKGQDRLSSSPLRGGGGVSKGLGEPSADGKVPVRNIGLLDVIPESVQSSLELVLIGLLALNLVVIIGIGTGFAVQALPTSNLELPESLVALSKKVEPLIEKSEFYFTPSLGVFFLLSTLLGSFKISQLSRGGTTYVEKKDLKIRK